MNGRGIRTPTRTDLRQILQGLSEPARHCMFVDHFNPLANRLTGSMDGIAQTNLLFLHHTEAEVWHALCQAAESLPEIALVLSRLDAATIERPASVALPSRNSLFTGRKQVLTALQKTLCEHRGVAIVGLGGLGKSSVALEYAHRNLGEHLLVYWLSAPDVGALGEGLLDLGRHLRETGLADGHVPSEQQPEMLREYVLRWLSSHDGWLTILDNADDLEPLRQLLPDFTRGHLLCTTRAGDPGQLGLHPFELSEFSTEEALAFLARRRGMAIQSSSDRAEKAAAELTQELGYLPLALEQAGAYMAAHKTSVQSYLAAYRKRRASLFPAGAAGRVRSSIATVWSLSFEKVENESPAAADLLRISAFLSPDFIPEQLLRMSAGHLGNALAAALNVDDPLAVDELLGPLLRHSLIRRLSPTNKGEWSGAYSVHRLVQDVVRMRLGPDEVLWADRAVRALNVAFPEVEFRSWPQCRVLLPCAEELFNHIERLGLASREAARLLNQTATYLWEQENEHAERICRHALLIREKTFGSDHPDTAESLNNLGVLLKSRGRTEEADPLHRRALAIRENALGLHHADTAESLNNLGTLLQSQGYHEDAERFLRRALDIRETTLGSGHPRTATTLNNLAGVLESQDKLEEAEPLLRRALWIRETVLGADHPPTAISLNALASLLKRKQKYAEAEPLLRRALAICDQSFGAQHTRTALIRDNLADLLACQMDGEKRPGRAVALRRSS